MGIYSEAFYKHWIIFPTMWKASRLSQWRTQGRPKCVKNVLKCRTFKLQAWITGKRLKIDGYIQRGVLQALNPLSNRVTCVKNVLKWRSFQLQAWITGKRLKIDGYIQWGILQALNPLSNRVTFTAIVPGAYTGEAEMYKKCAKMANF